MSELQRFPWNLHQFNCSLSKENSLLKSRKNLLNSFKSRRTADTLLMYLLYIYFACLGVRLFVSNKLQNGWTDLVQIFCETSRDPREGLWMIEFRKFASIKILFLKISKIHEFFFIKSAIFFYNLHKDNMFLNGRWARTAQ